MRNVAIIGAGQLGSRHLQALALCEEPLKIFIIDPSREARNISLERFNTVDKLNNKIVIESASMDILPNLIDFVVISTTSFHRLKILSELHTKTEIKYLILEKFLFPREDEYLAALEIISNSKTITYVNCPRRLWPVYRKISIEMSDDTNVNLTVQGNNWNLASNAIHFLDLFIFITKENEVIFNTEKLDDEILKNKRAGYIELTGTLEGMTLKNNHISLTSNKQGTSSLMIQLTSNQHEYLIDEGKGIISRLDKNKNIWLDEEFEVLKQSELTNIVFEDLCKREDCNLVQFSESVKHHLSFLNAINRFLIKNNNKGMIT